MLPRRCCVTETEGTAAGADLARRLLIAIQRQVLAENPDWLDSLVLEFSGTRYGMPVASQQLSHLRSRAGLAQQAVPFIAQQGWPPFSYVRRCLRREETEDCLIK